MNRPALQIKQVGVSRMAFRALKVFGTFEKRTPVQTILYTIYLYYVVVYINFILGLKFFELVSILFAIVPDYGNEYMTKGNKNGTSFNNFAPKLNLNHNIIYKYKRNVTLQQGYKSKRSD